MDTVQQSDRPDEKYWMRLLDEVFAECQADVIDLLGIGDAAGEQAYLANARDSYRRTVADIATLLARRPRNDQPVRVLEVGAFLGVVSLTLARAGCVVTALDIPEFMANPRLQRRFSTDGVTTIAANLRDYPLPVASESFDLVIMCETLEHLNFNPMPILSEVNRALCPEGRFYVALPNLASLPNRIKLLFGFSIHNPIGDFRAQLSDDSNMVVGIHWREYTRIELIELLESQGFSCEKHRFVNASVASFLGKIIYRFAPAVRPFQVTIAKKVRSVKPDFHFTGATT